MKTISRVGHGFSASVFAMSLIGIVVVFFVAIGVFVSSLPVLQWCVGFALLAVSTVIGIARKQFLGLALVAVWAAAVGFALLAHGQVSVSVMTESLMRAIPWTFVACCGCAVLFNATL
ncbi:hypothetical protein ACPRNU_22465 [Chromobacterium vaccinii]|uniref:hypothetical protein n=1 Tax=Chromobacterium vaccinii TaxID=1108595 RepID=UPI003C73964C